MSASIYQEGAKGDLKISFEWGTREGETRRQPMMRLRNPYMRRSWLIFMDDAHLWDDADGAVAELDDAVNSATSAGVDDLVLPHADPRVRVRLARAQRGPRVVDGLGHGGRSQRQKQRSEDGGRERWLLWPL